MRMIPYSVKMIETKSSSDKDDIRTTSKATCIWSQW
jgi:hypothetical protein